MEQAEQSTVLDSLQQRLGEIYARSLIGVGQSSNQIDELLAQLHSFVDDVLLKLPAFRAAMESPRISFEQKEKLIESAVGKTASREFKNFLKVLTRKGRFACLPAVRIAAQKQFNDLRGRVEALLITAETVDDPVRRQVAEQLAKKLGKEVDLKARVNPQIIAGMVLRVGDTVYDGSVKNQLRRLRASAVQSAYQDIRDSLEKFVSE